MGVPAFFRWLARKYPSVVINCIEERPTDGDGNRVPVRAEEENPNGVEFDNLYLDMNGIIHPCTHPEDKPAPKNEDEMMVAIFECIDRLFAIVRPRKLLYMAIDGVAPRAKMNQQRSRRFRASKETAEKLLTMDKLRTELESQGFFLPAAKPAGEHFDSNCITPGTPFMARLSKCLQYYVYERMNTDGAWKNIKVVLSDANVPGEGEHKIMDYIRRQRAQPDHDPNTQHVLCGADADLIMLGLATHEPNFTIIREEFKPNQPKPCDLCRQMGHEMVDCQGAPRPQEGVEYVGEDKNFGSEVVFIFVRLSVLREYLRRDLDMPNLPFPYDFERAIDDWVFMCFFVGNDFLPHLPSLEIRENAIDRLVKLYKDAVYKTGGFLTKSGVVNPSRVQLIMQELGRMEDAIFKERQQREITFRQRNKAKRRRERGPAFVPKGQFAPHALGAGRAPVQPVQNARREAASMRMHSNSANADAAQALRASLGSGGSGGGGGGGGGSGSGSGNSGRGGGGGETPGSRKRNRPENAGDSDSEEEPPDEVRLYEDGFKDRYYESKFGVLPAEVTFRHKVAYEYTIGLCWVLRYYYQGCASWKWYFPYHYAPFASDFVNIGDTPTDFALHEPFKPLEQLMSVFPAASKSHVPEPWGLLMCDPDCPIIDFYPEDFKIDLNGKKYAWQGVALLPFVDEARLKAALAPVYPLLTDAEVSRNVRGDDRLYVREGHSGAGLLKAIYLDGFDEDQEIEILGKIFQGMRGRVLFSKDYVSSGGEVGSPVAGLDSVQDSRVVCVRYRDPKYVPSFIFPAVRLNGAKEPPGVLKPCDLKPHEAKDWRPRMGFSERRDQASLGRGGHRMLGHHVDRGGRGGGVYGAVPPPAFGPERGFRQQAQNERTFGRDGGGFRQAGSGRGIDRGGYGSGYGGGGYQGGGGGYGGAGYQREHHSTMVEAYPGLSCVRFRKTIKFNFS